MHFFKLKRANTFQLEMRILIAWYEP